MWLSVPRNQDNPHSALYLRRDADAIYICTQISLCYLTAQIRYSIVSCNYYKDIIFEVLENTQEEKNLMILFSAEFVICFEIFIIFKSVIFTQLLL